MGEEVQEVRRTAGLQSTTVVNSKCIDLHVLNLAGSSSVDFGTTDLTAPTDIPRAWDEAGL